MKKDNKGFSLVELIVVVLIMGILAVALTPQVLKWVNHSRIANDLSLMDTVIANTQTALTNGKAYGDVDNNITITIKDSGEVSMNPDKATLKLKIAEYSGYTSWDDFAGATNTKAKGGQIVVTIHENGKRVTGEYKGASNHSDYQSETSVD